MQKSPMKIVELCVYILVIIAAIIWLFAGGRIYRPTVQPVIFYETPDNKEAPTPAVLPRSEVFPE